MSATNNKQNQNRCYESIWSSLCMVGFGGMISFFTGCAMCCGPYDYHYPNHGGLIQRSDPVWGRVGSVYSDPGPFGGPSSDYNLDTHGSMTEVDDGSDSTGGNGGELLPPGRLDDPNQGSGSRNNDLLPPPRRDNDRPGPDDETTYVNPSPTEFQTQSRQRRWR